MLPLRLPPVAVFTLLAVLLGSLVAVAHEPGTGSGKAPSGRNPVSAGEMPVLAPKGPDSAALRPVATKDGAWSGYAFDACRAPSQRTMDRWLHDSPFVGVGIYLGGIHRACEQRHLTPRWVSRQTRNGWQLLPIWVGPQAACTGYAHRIPHQPARGFAAARRAGVHQARLAKTTARRLGIGPGQAVFYDIEPYDTSRGWCRRSAMVFLDAWTRELHRGGYRSGVYSHVKAAISSISRAPRRFVRPDAVWYSWIDRAGAMPRKYVDDASFMRTSRVHQFALDKHVRFGGVSMAIDWNLVTLGDAAARGAGASCGREADRLRPRPIRRGARGRDAEVVSCLLSSVGTHQGRPRKVYDRHTADAVRAFQRDRGLPESGVVERATLTALFAAGRRPLLKQGSTGEPVRRLQRSLNAALGRTVAVDGIFGPATESAVRHYQRVLGRRSSGVVSLATWRPLANGTTAKAAVAARPDPGGGKAPSSKDGTASTKKAASKAPATKKQATAPKPAKPAKPKPGARQPKSKPKRTNRD